MTRRCRGFVLPSAIFLLVVLAALGAFALTLSSSQHVGAALDLQGAQAYRAAQAGIEWGLFQTANGSCADTTLTFAGTTLATFTTSVTCEAATARELATTVNLFRLTATACSQPPCPNPAPGANYVERQLTATVSR